MRKNLKKLFSYYKPYMGIFVADMFFAFGAAAVSLVIPLVVRYITSEVVYWGSSQALHTIVQLGVFMLVLIAAQCYCNYFISNYGHVMGARIEYDMRAEIFSHYQKLSFRFYDDQKVGQLMSRITSDLFDITELLHHGPENIVISLIRIIGAFVIMINISPRLTLAAFALVPFMLVAGDHALNDMAGDGPKSWKSRLEAAGVGVRCRMRGLGALPEVQALYGARLREIV